MQNTLAVMSMPTLPAEPAFVTPTVEGGDGSFTESFVEAGSDADYGVRPDDAAGSDGVVPLSWPVMVAPRSAFLAMADGSAGPDRNLCAEADLMAGSGALQPTAGGDAPVLASVPGIGEASADIVNLQEWVSVELPAVGLGEAGPLAVVESIASGSDTDMSATGSETRALRDLVPIALQDPVSHLPTVARISELGSDGDIRHTDGSKQTAIHTNDNESGAKVAPSNSSPFRERDVSTLSNRNETVVSEGSKLPNLPAPRSEQPTAQPLSDDDWSILNEPKAVVTTQQMLPEAQTDSEFVKPGTVSESLAELAPGDGSELVAQYRSDLSSVLALSPSQDLETEPSAISSSFWERFFSDPAMFAPGPERASAPDASSPDAVLPLGKATSAVVSEVSDTFALGAVPTDAAPQVEVAVESPVRDVSFRRNSIENPKVTAPPLAESFGASLADTIVSDWGKDLQSLGQGMEFLSSSGLSASTKASAGFPVPPPNHSALPFSPVASQLVNVLSCSPGTVTELALAPEELGRVRLRMEPDAGNPDRMLVLITVERPETLDLFRRHAGELAEAIRNAGYSGADIGFGQNGTDGSPQHRKEPSPAGSNLPLEETGHIEPVRMLAAGTSLDLRL